MEYNHYTHSTSNSYLADTDNVSDFLKTQCKSLLTGAETLGTLPFKYRLSYDETMCIVSILSLTEESISTNFMCFSNSSHNVLKEKIEAFCSHCFTKIKVSNYEAASFLYHHHVIIPEQDCVLYTVFNPGIINTNPLLLASTEQAIFCVLYDYYKDKG